MIKTYDPQNPISYLTVVSTFLHHHDDISEPGDIFYWVNSNCLCDISETPLAKQLDSMTPLPPGFIQRMYQFLEPEGRHGEIEVVFLDNLLINFRSQLFFKGWFSNRKALRYIAYALRPLITGFLGEDNYQYDPITSSYLNTTAISDFIVAYRKVPGYSSVSTWITHRGYYE